MNNNTTITIDDEFVSIRTDEDTAKELLMKNPRCSSTTDGDSVLLRYSREQVQKLSSILKSTKH